MDKAPSVILQKSCKTSRIPDTLVRASIYLSAFARRRSGVRIPSAPLLKDVDLQEKLEPKMSFLTASGALVQQPCSNAEAGRMPRI